MKRTLVDISLGVVRGLILLVNDSVLCSGGSGREGCVVVLGDGLVGLLGCLSSGTLDGLRDVVCGVLEEIILALKRGVGGWTESSGARYHC